MIKENVDKGAIPEQIDLARMTVEELRNKFSVSETGSDQFRKLEDAYNAAKQIAADQWEYAEGALRGIPFKREDFVGKGEHWVETRAVEQEAAEAFKTHMINVLAKRR